jgi:hypothetical protein
MSIKIERNAVLNVLGGFLAGYGVAGLVCFFVLVEAFRSRAPHVPDPAHGLIYPHNDHGWITYFSAFQATSCWLLLLTSISFAAIGWFILPKGNWIVRQGRLSIRSTFDFDDPHRIARWLGLAGLCMAPVVIFIFAPPFVSWLNQVGFVARF